MAARMEVTLLESRMSMEDYKKLQGLFIVSPGVSRSLSRSEFIRLAASSVGRGSEEEYGLLFDSVVVSQGQRGLFFHGDAVKQEARIDSGGLCSFLQQELSEKLKHSRVKRVPCWKPPRSLTCPHRDPVQKVSALYFTSAQMYLFERRSRWTDSDSALIIQWDDVVKGKHHCCSIVQHQAHKPAWVRKVLYLDSLEAFVSCSTRPQSSIAIGWEEKGGKSLQVTTFFTERGVWDLDYHRELKLIATAGADHRVLLWNPYVTSQPSYLLSGHVAPVAAVCFLQKKKHLLSYSRDKVLCLWDVSSQLCIHRLGGVFPATREDARTLLLLIEERQLLLLTFNSLLVLLESTKEETRASGHKHPVTCVLYNSLFRHVISSDTGSSVICWLADTGQKVKQIHRCHGNAEISTMALDGTQTRLFTAGNDGEVKVWDFNGRCLHRMNVALGKAAAISHMLLLRTSLLVMGWQRMLTVFRRHSFSKSHVDPSEWKGGVHHRAEVLCAAFQPPQTLVTGSRDGEIIVWNNDTEKALRKLQLPAKHEEFKQTEHSPDTIATVTFLPGRTSAQIANGGANLASSGSSGLVRLWNTVHGRLLGQFTAHEAQLGSVVMTVSPCGKFLVTADRAGAIKTWDMEHYCLESDGGVVTESPELVHSFRPHKDGVTHLHTSFHADRLILLSASSDCRVALSYLPGETIGFFGQEEQWSIMRPACVHPQRDTCNDRHPDNTA
ncbi:WD repeat-containing protein 49 isoform X2 [Hippocampus comes]|uniref:WD repeat-containing protein 49 isoform X2 n=1 Tax=Hippocampus comes TaxID=109280 RepID=UPI00094E8724|nr:PREDICTED: WD repeat-containing protein 49 isoform X2 [Hippocampus comes]